MMSRRMYRYIYILILLLFYALESNAIPCHGIDGYFVGIDDYFVDPKVNKVMHAIHPLTDFRPSIFLPSNP